MPAITYDQFLTASTLALQAGAGSDGSGVHRDWVKQLLPAALNKLAEAVAEDPAKRPLLVKEIEVPITADPNGIWKGTINTDAFRQILFSALKYSHCVDKASMEEASQPLELLYKEDWKRVGNAARYLNPEYGYYSLRGAQLIARPPASPALSGTLVLNAPAIPDLCRRRWGSLLKRRGDQRDSRGDAESEDRLSASGRRLHGHKRRLHEALGSDGERDDRRNEGAADGRVLGRCSAQAHRLLGAGKPLGSRAGDDHGRGQPDQGGSRRFRFVAETDGLGNHGQPDLRARERAAGIVALH
jgi:hypothetical protein